jgi:hypothetical protein
LPNVNYAFHYFLKVITIQIKFPEKGERFYKKTKGRGLKFPPFAHITTKTLHTKYLLLIIQINSFEKGESF